ncbi:glucan biosynthesis protein D [Aestuariivirga litoralis]|uniref:Glucan biosynthesis protein D n=1 Tax=Aestuariivirga litoralis TaxID=2650924 RepID=A0A2W2BA88_9HYPH|nr:glucan biosynthesis protein [Aestuariivirga litoralis]PZF77194.1 glucan biosynthesis protein D [Aestuariivirga litoralis]
MNHTLSRRALLLAAGAAGLAAAAPAMAEEVTGLTLSGPVPFSFDSLVATAREMAMKPFTPTPVRAAELLEKIDFDAYQQITFRPEDALFKGSRYPVRLFHLGRYFKSPVKIAIVEGGQSRDVLYDPEIFSFGPKAGAIATRLPKDLGFAGFRVHEGDTNNDWLAFLGAAYFRSSGELNQYGISARGLSIDTTASGPEEFPRFTEFYLEEKADALVITALLDSQSATGAFRFTCSRPKAVIMDVEARIFTRKDIEQLGFAPLTSMFWFTETNRRQARDWRPQVHDSEGLAIWTGAGERIWRPLNNPPRVMTNSFVDKNPRGFGLVQRDRDFRNYEDDGVFYDRRPTLWVEPRGDWGEGEVQLVEIPTEDEVHDNIVAFWTPRAAVKAGQSFALDYRLHWVDAEPYLSPAIGRVIATRRGNGGNPAVRDKATGYVKYVIDFAGGDLATRESTKNQAIPDITVSRGRVVGPFAIRVAGTDHWRIIFDLDVEGGEPVDLRAYLRTRDGKALSETWLFQHFPQQTNW